MEKEEFSEIILREKESSLHISRIPKNTKEAFIQLSKDEFAGDYGMTLKSLFDNFALWKLLFENVDFKLDHIINLLINKPEVEQDGIKLLNGNILKKNKKEVAK